VKEKNLSRKASCPPRPLLLPSDQSMQFFNCGYFGGPPPKGLSEQSYVSKPLFKVAERAKPLATEDFVTHLTYSNRSLKCQGSLSCLISDSHLLVCRRLGSQSAGASAGYPNPSLRTYQKESKDPGLSSSLFPELQTEVASSVQQRRPLSRLGNPDCMIHMRFKLLSLRIGDTSYLFFLLSFFLYLFFFVSFAASDWPSQVLWKGGYSTGSYGTQTPTAGWRLNKLKTETFALSFQQFLLHAADDRASQVLRKGGAAAGRPGHAGATGPERGDCAHEPEAEPAADRTAAERDARCDTSGVASKQGFCQTYPRLFCFWGTSNLLEQ
jgi:hypothetical protein